MAARGILHNPGLFVGHKITQLCVVQDWLSMKHANFFVFHHHLVYMLDRLFTRADRRVFNYLRNADDVVDFIKKKFDIAPVHPNFYVSLTKPGCDFDGGAYFSEKVKEAESDYESIKNSDEYLNGIDCLYS